MRAACYARYSSDLQRETSIDDQLAVARRYRIGSRVFDPEGPYLTSMPASWEIPLTTVSCVQRFPLGGDVAS
jgi:hypothetical protein